MKTKIKRHSRSVISVILALSMLVSCMMVGLIATDAAKVTDNGAVGATINNDTSVGGKDDPGQWKKNWRGQVYFRAPESWGLTSSDHVYAVITRTTDATVNNYVCFFEMTHVQKDSFDDSVLYHVDINTYHYSWDKNEFFGFVADTDEQSDQNIKLNNLDHYSKPQNYLIYKDNNGSGYGSVVYYAHPTGSTDDNYIDYCWDSNNFSKNRDLIKKDQSAEIYTDGSKSVAGGSVTATGFYFDGGSATVLDSSTDTSAADKNPLTYGAVSGTKMTMTATPTTSEAADYKFDGWFESTSAVNPISTDTTLTPYYINGEKNVYARFSHLGEEVTVSQPVSGGTIASNRIYAQENATVTLSSTPDAGYAFGSYTVTKTSDGSPVTMATANTFVMPDEAVTVTANFTPIHRYFITSAGANDSTNGFTGGTWANEYLLTSPSSGVYTVTYNDIPTGWYRFKVKDYYGASVDKIYGGAYTTYDSGEYTTAHIPAANRSAENNGNAKFYLQGKSNLTVTFNSNTGAITVTAAEPTTADNTFEYYVVGMYSDGTAGMFGNVWGDDWKTFDSADKMTETSSGSGVWTKTYTSFGGSYGTYSYKIARVYANGTVETIDNAGGTGANLTVDVKDGATSVVFKFDSTQATASQVSATPSYESGWQPSDPGESSYSVPSSSKKYYIWSGDSENWGNETKRGYVEASKNSTTGKWLFDVTTQAKAYGSLYFYLASNNTVPTNTSKPQGSNMEGDATNTVNGSSSTGTDSTVTYNGSTVYKCRMKQNNEISGSKLYVKISDISANLKKMVVEVTFSGSQAQYKIYYNVTGSGGGTDPTYVDNVDIYAKSACLRDGNYNRFANLAKTEVVSITTPDGVVRTKSTWLSGKTWNTYSENGKYGSTYGYELVKDVPVGSKVKLRTTLSPNNETFTGSTLFKDSHYLKAYSFNGYTYELHEKNATGVYEEEWTAEAINTTNMDGGNTVEITPIYYLQDNKYTKTFFIDGYEGLLQEKWGTLLCVYPYYKGSSNKANAFGGYPGQPMLYWGGKYQMEIPLTVDGTATGKEVKGLTMHNAYWDLLHRKLDGKCDDGHCQTYDYDDFYKIYKEKNADTIFFRYKYFPKKDYTYNGATITAGHDNYGDNYSYDNHRFENGSLNTAAKCVSSGNGVEIVTDYYGKQVDVFGTILTDSQKSTYSGTQTKELLLVSTGYKNTYVGHYATEWAVYAPASGYTKNDDEAHKFIGYISSSMLYLNNIGRVSQYTGGTNTGDGQMSSSKYKSTYNYLKQYYEGVPALISYEKEIHNYSLDQADRSDGKWYYSTTSDKLNANIQIQCVDSTTAPAIDNVTGSTNASTTQWYNDDFSTTLLGAGSEKNIGAQTGNSAYFTNTTPEYLYGKVTAENILADPSKQFTFQATSANGWEFVGWVRYSDGKYYEISDKDGLGSSNISANDTYIARFKQAASGSLVISHNIVQDSDHTGNGTKYLKVEVLSSDEATVKKTFVEEDGKDVDVSKYITSGSTDKIRITLTTDPYEDCSVDARSVGLDSSQTYYSAYAPDTTGLPTSSTFTNTITLTAGTIFTDGVTALRYTTKLTKADINYAYRIVYTYTSRFWGQQTYTVEGFIDEQQAAKYFSGVKNIATLNKSFIISSTPYEKNFRQKIDWNYDSMTNNAAGEQTASVTINGVTKENVYLMTATVGSSNTLDDTVRAEFFLPYKYNEETKAETGLDLYDEEGTKLEGTEIAFDEQSYESSTVKSQAGHLFNYDNSIPVIPTSGQTTEDFPYLVKAAPYVLKKGVWNSTDSKWEFTNVDFHYTDTYTTKEYDGNMSFKIDGTYYYATATAPSDIPVGATTQKLNAENTVSWYEDNDGTSTKTPATLTYAMNSGDNVYYFYFETVEGVSTCMGYKISTKGEAIDGIIQNTNAEMTTAPSDISYTFYKKFYFSRWDIYTADGKTYVASSFANSRAFNYSGYEDYIVIPVYNQKESNSGRSTTITFMGDTRNQWNMGGLGHYKEGAVAENGEESTGMTDCDIQGDKLLIDFGLAFNNAGTKLTTSDKAGFIIERLEKLDTTAGTSVAALKDSTAITNLSYYEKKYATGDRAWDETTIKNAASSYATNGTKTSLTNRVATIYRACTISKLDNFDRMQYTNTFTNKKDAGETDQAQYIYRATSYLKVNGKDIVVSEPIYFTLYDLASR